MFTGTKLLLVSCLLTLVATIALGEDRLSAEDVLKKHLDSIGTDSVRAAAKSRVVEGTTEYRVLVGGASRFQGKEVMASDGRKIQLLLKIAAPQYVGERFISDGQKTYVARTREDKTFSEFGQFLDSEDLPLHEGLLGGVLSTDWALLDLDSRKARLKSLGLKKIDGTELYAITYEPKKTTDLEITLYFDPATFHHVRTVYEASVHAGLGRTGTPDAMGPPPEVARTPAATSGDVVSARRQETRYRIEERFSDFKTTDGLTLPSHYDLRFQEELGGGFTKLVEWESSTTRVLNNVTLDARNFEIH